MDEWASLARKKLDHTSGANEHRPLERIKDPIRREATRKKKTRQRLQKNTIWYTEHAGEKGRRRVGEGTEGRQQGSWAGGAGGDGKGKGEEWHWRGGR